MYCFQRPKDPLVAEVDDQLVMLDMSSGKYVALNVSAKYIWQALDKPRSFESLIETLMSRFDVKQSRLEPEVKAFLEDAVKRNIIERVGCTSTKSLA